MNIDARDVPVPQVQAPITERNDEIDISEDEPEVMGAAEPDSDGANARAPEPHISEVAPSINADVRSGEESEDEFGFKTPHD